MGVVWVTDEVVEGGGVRREEGVLGGGEELEMFCACVCVCMKLYKTCSQGM